MAYYRKLELKPFHCTQLFNSLDISSDSLQKFYSYGLPYTLGWSLRKSSLPFFKTFASFTENLQLRSEFLFPILQIIAEATKTYLLVNIQIPGCKWPFLFLPTVPSLGVKHIFISPLRGNLRISGTYHAVSPGSFLSHKIINPIGQQLGRSTTAAAWASAKGISKYVRSTSYEFQYSLHNCLTTHIVRTSDTARPIQSIPLSPTERKNLIGFRAKSEDKTLRAAFNYTLLVEGKVRGQRALSLKQFMKYVRRSSRTMDYYNRVVTTELDRFLLHANKFVIATNKMNIKWTPEPVSHCCDMLLHPTDVSFFFLCAACGSWKAFKRDEASKSSRKRRLSDN